MLSIVGKKKTKKIAGHSCPAPALSRRPPPLPPAHHLSPAQTAAAAPRLLSCPCHRRSLASAAADPMCRLATPPAPAPSPRLASILVSTSYRHAARDAVALRDVRMGLTRITSTQLLPSPPRHCTYCPVHGSPTRCSRVSEELREERRAAVRDGAVVGEV